MSTVLWIVLLGLAALLAVLQVIGVRALRSWGVQPSGAVIALRAANYAIVLGILVFAFVKLAVM